MAQIVTITHSDTSKSGKPRVYFDGKNDWKDAYLLGAKCPDPPKGVPIEVQTHSWRPDNGKYDMWFLDSFKVVEGPVAAPQPAQAAQVRPSTPVPAAPGAPYSEPERMFVSNIVAAAINAGAVKSPVDLISWCNGALTALRNVKVVPPTVRDEFDDDVQGF